MAFSTWHQNPTFLKPHGSLPPKPCTATTSSPSTYVPVRCGGPRSQRGPLVKGRTLSIEAIQAVQTLKRLHRTKPSNVDDLVSKNLSRLIKSDLMAVLKELLRQDQCALALRAFSAVRSEYQAELSLYAEMVQALARNGMAEDVDRLIVEMGESEGGIECDDKGLVELIKAVIGAQRRESTVRIYGMMKKSGWGWRVEADEYVAKVLSNGLKNFGEEALSQEVESEYKKSFAKFSRDRLVKPII
ncbi:protein THYLAKOID ASSEMBLY 8, chloroplastic [Neltuma alba]|uniref:protein THYLAKOID ASSEMBLY 8, chloroplastic-like n=1 Tax=Neltuma alba TaxID=207710 RepID=UPI0010A3F6CE|nr:protein THYLAKOID ASSEMBLY 8, chloroplastic-like [Prosopis alba]XP_028757314.1 protein THYLAKOID ASSEMBLY 8, chloroplastic-like [Prosopis alba]